MIQCIPICDSINPQGTRLITMKLTYPKLYIHDLITGTACLNFFDLRLDPAADPTLQLLAQSAWKVWNESQPQKLYPHEWHLPYIDGETWDILNNTLSKRTDLKTEFLGGEEYGQLILHAIKISAARCARLPYLSSSTNKHPTIEEDLELYNKLVGGNIIYASSLEHIATPDSWKKKDLWSEDILKWEHPHQSGNLGPGWRQYSKMLPNESITPLPPAYQVTP